MIAMSDFETAKPYKDAVKNRNNIEEAQAKLVRDNLRAYDRFHDMSAKTSVEVARDTYPIDAAIVDKIDDGTQTVIESRLAVPTTLVDCMIEKMRQLSKQPVDGSRGVAQLMVDALQEVGQFRIEYLDGIDSKFDQVIENGHGFSPKERARLINRLVSTWAKGYGIAPKELQPMAQAWALAARQETAEQLGVTLR